jgi:endonuclease III
LRLCLAGNKVFQPPVACEDFLHRFAGVSALSTPLLACLLLGGHMVRGVVARQPAKTGRQEGSRSVARGGQARGSSREQRRPPQKPAPRAAVARVPKRQAGQRLSRAGSRYNPIAPERVQEILKRLDQTYPDVTCALTHRNAWELLVATILSAQSTDVNVNRVTPTLFQKYPTVQDFARLQPEQLEPDIRSTGFFRNKSKSVVGAAKKIVSDFSGEVPADMDSLLTLPGVARKTANVVLGTWFKKGVGVVVDTHVTRISRRLELTKNTDAPKIEQDLMQIIPQEKWILFSHQVIWHGRKLCVARAPNCVDCPLENICHAGDKTWSTVETHKKAK